MHFSEVLVHRPLVADFERLPEAAMGCKADVTASLQMATFEQKQPIRLVRSPVDCRRASQELELRCA